MLASVQPKPQPVRKLGIPAPEAIRLRGKLGMLRRQRVKHLRLFADHPHGVLGRATRRAHLLPYRDGTGRKGEACFGGHRAERDEAGRGSQWL